MSGESQLHFRRCHVCGEVNCVKDGDVKICIHCHKLLAPFFFFQQTKEEGYSDSEDKKNNVLNNLRFNTNHSNNSELINKKFHYQPLKGITVIW